MLSLIMSVLLSALSFWIVSRLVPGWKLKDFPTAIVVALVYGVLNLLAWWPAVVAKIALLPLFILLPKFIAKFVIGGALSLAFTVVLVMVTDKAVDGFEVDDLPTAIVGAFVLNIARGFLHLLFLL